MHKTRMRGRDSKSLTWGYLSPAPDNENIKMSDVAETSSLPIDTSDAVQSYFLAGN